MTDPVSGTTFSDGSWAADCPFCEGRGVYPDTAFTGDHIEIDPCPICSGRGVNVVGGGAALTYDCRYCDGSGRAWDTNGYFVGTPCPICEGIGHVTLRGARKGEKEQGSVWEMLHPRVQELARKKFEDGHFADAVETALKEVNACVKARIKRETGAEMDGAAAMERALSPTRPLLRMGDLSTDSGRNMQVGYLKIFSGAMTGIRNPKAHENLEIDAVRSLHHLFLSSLLLHKIDEAADYDDQQGSGTGVDHGAAQSVPPPRSGA